MTQKKLISYLEIMLGAGMTAAAFGLIVLPLGFAAGGVTGLSVLLHKIIPLPVSTIVLILNIALFVLGWCCAGREFALKTLLVSLLFPLLLEFFQKCSMLSALTTAPLASAILAGITLGFGGGLILRGNGSSGGFDILGIVLHRKLGVSVSLVMYVCDCTIILTQAVSSGIRMTAYGVLVILISSLTIHCLLTHPSPTWIKTVRKAHSSYDSFQNQKNTSHARKA